MLLKKLFIFFFLFFVIFATEIEFKEQNLIGVGTAMDFSSVKLPSFDRSILNHLSGEISSTVLNSVTLYHHAAVDIILDSTTTITLSFSQQSVTIRFNPGIHIQVRVLPDIRITRIRWSFETQSFTIENRSTWQVLGIYARTTRAIFEYFLNSRVRNWLPPPMRSPSYSFFSDPNVFDTLQQLQNTLHNFAGAPESSTKSGSASESKKEGNKSEGKKSEGNSLSSAFLRNLNGQTARINIRNPSEFIANIPNIPYRVRIEADARLSIVIRTTGILASPRLSTLVFQCTSGQRHIHIDSTSRSVVAPINGLTMQRITIRPGVRFSFDYRLNPEVAGDFFRGLISLFRGGISGGVDFNPRPGAGSPLHNIPPTRLEILRRELDQRLQNTVPPIFQAFLRQYDRIVPGYSLMDFFYINPATKTIKESIKKLAPIRSRRFPTKLRSRDR